MYHFINNNKPYRTVPKLWRERPGEGEGDEAPEGAGPEKAPALQILGTSQHEKRAVSERP